MIFSLTSPTDVALVKTALANGKKIGLTSGTYDLLHYLHHIFLEKCRRQCDVLIVGIDSDRLVKETKGDDRPLVPENQRVEMVNALASVDAVYVQDSTDAWLRAVIELNVDVIFKNDQFDPDEIIGREHAKVIIVPDVKIPDSTTAIVEECIRRRDKETEDGSTSDQSD
jgi:D-beta-D-heptose 7-phosphate kinase/D-beta-D-heptose 1-phosphate adenosyltransferase